MAKKSIVLRGLTALLTFVFSLSIVTGVTLEAYKSTIDTNLGTQSEKFVSESTEADPLYNKFTPSAEVLNEDGTGNSHALIQKAMNLNRQQAAEGAVLLKNENNALPLASGSKVTLLGIRSHVPLVGSSFGVKAWGGFIDLEQALSQNKTDFANTITTSVNTNRKTGETTVGRTVSSWSGDEFEFEGAGYEINPTMVSIYEKLNETYNHANNESVAGVQTLGLNGVSARGEAQQTTGTGDDVCGVGVVHLTHVLHSGSRHIVGGVDVGQTAGGASAAAEDIGNADHAVAAGEADPQDRINIGVVLQIADLNGSCGVDQNDDLLAGLLCGLDDVTLVSGQSQRLVCAQTLCDAAGQIVLGLCAGTADDHDGRIAVLGKAGLIAAVHSCDLGQRRLARIVDLGGRLYETRYADCVNGVGNAASPVGAYASSTEWNYDNEVAYGFGYGLSYTTFTQEIQGQPEISVNIDSETGAPQAYATFNVKVTNTGKVPGKTSVQIYGQAPYTEGGLEKVAIQLLNFEKSSELAPGASEIVSVKVDLQYIASYDMEHDNGDGTTGTYVLDPGTYYFAAGNGAHDALNNILVLQGADKSKMVGTGSAAAAVAQEITEDLISRTAFSVSKTGEKISNQLPYSDWNYYQPGEVTYLTRADWAGTFPKTYDQMTLTSEKLISDLNGNYYTIATDDDTSDIKWGKNSNLMFYQMFGLDFDDPKWDELLDKMTLEEAQYLATYGGPSIPGVESIGTVETYMTENAGNGVAVNLNASKDTNAPWTISADDPNGNWHPEVFANAPLVAASFNNELYRAVGEFVGEESLFVGIPILWGPGMNTHRQAYNGRNGEYYSEDPVLTGNAGMEFAIGALEYGLVAAPKHYAFNDQESERGGVSPYMTEQRAREIELRAYQIAFEATKYDTDDYNAGMRGLMTSFSKIGGVECTASVGMNTNILKKEWGFKGYAVTDIYDDTDLYGAVLNSGVTCFDTRGISGFYGSTTLENDSTFATQVDGSSVSSTLLNGDANLQQHVKESAHNILYAMAQSNLMNRYNSTTRIIQSMTWWRAAYIALIAVSGILTVACGAGYVFSVRKKSKKEVH